MAAQNEFPKLLATHELAEGMTIDTRYHGKQVINHINRSNGGPYIGIHRALTLQFVSGCETTVDPGERHMCYKPGPFYGRKYEAKMYFSTGQIRPLCDNELESLAVRVCTFSGIPRLKADLVAVADFMYGSYDMYHADSDPEAKCLILSLKPEEMDPLEEFMIPNPTAKAVMAELLPRVWGLGKTRMPIGHVIIVQEVPADV